MTYVDIFLKILKHNAYIYAVKEKNLSNFIQ